MSCEICYIDFPDYKLISAGCCSLKLCKECIEKCNKCPQCKTKFFWSKDDEETISIQQYYLEKQYSSNLQCSLSIAEADISKLAHRILDQGKEIKILKEIIKSDIEVSHLYQKQYEKVIQKYHLNIN
jgi:hypothetical protein